jgi:hypothetical protein
VTPVEREPVISGAKQRFLARPTDGDSLLAETEGFPLRIDAGSETQKNYPLVSQTESALARISHAID